MKLQLISTGQLCRICRKLDGTPLSSVTLHDWVSCGAVECSFGGRGTGDQRKFSLTETLQAALFGALQAEGYSRQQALAAVRLLHGVDQSRLERVFASGKQFIAVSGLNANGILTRAQAAEMMRCNLAGIEASEKAGNPLVSPFVVDLKVIWTNVLAGVAEFERERNQHDARRKASKLAAIQ